MSAKKVESSAVTCKVILIGQSGVGKSSITNRYVINTFSSNLNPTHGASFATKVVNFYEHDKLVKFDIWDTAGQEKYHSVSKIYFQNCNVVILVYDITRQSSFDEIKNIWYPMVKDGCMNKNLILVIAANKSDMYELEEVDEEKVKDFAKSSIGIDNLFETVGSELLALNTHLEDQDESVNKSIVITKKRNSRNINENKQKKCAC